MAWSNQPICLLRNDEGTPLYDAGSAAKQACGVWLYPTEEERGTNGTMRRHIGAEEKARPPRHPCDNLSPADCETGSEER